MDIFRDYIIFLPTSLHQPAYLLTSATTHLSTTLSTLLSHIQSKPDIASIALLLLLLFISLQFLKLLYRTLVFWVVLAMRLAFYGGMAGLALWVWTRGVEGAVEDVEGLMGFWKGEYEGLKRREKGGMPGWGSARAGGQRVGGTGRAKWR